MKIEFFKKENDFKKKDFTFNPNLYWELILLVTFVLIASSFFFGRYLFEQVNQVSSTPQTNDASQVPTVDKNRVQKVLNYFSERQQESTEILNKPASVVDPSR
jgi:hypothetical protein